MTSKNTVDGRRLILQWSLDKLEGKLRRHATNKPNVRGPALEITGGDSDRNYVRNDNKLLDIGEDTNPLRNIRLNLS